MNFDQLIEKYGNEEIPYFELLGTEEWTAKRNEIISRDNRRCSNCGRTKSLSNSGYNITFNTNEKVNYERIIRLNYPLLKYKQDYGLSKIVILNESSDGQLYCGLSSNGILFITDYDSYRDQPKENLVIHYWIHPSGKIIPLIVLANKPLEENTFYLPEIIENPLHLNVHHKFYIRERLPWEYEDDDLITYCHECHNNYHSKVKVPYYALVNGELVDLQYIPCIRCNGIGYFPEYRHVQNGICFRCGGKRYEELIIGFSDTLPH